MNEIAQKTYDLLMTEPEWFNMARHETCILGALHRIAPNDGPFISAFDGSWLLGLSPEASMDLCLDGDMGWTAVQAATALKKACEAA